MASKSTLDDTTAALFTHTPHTIITKWVPRGKDSEMVMKTLLREVVLTVGYNHEPSFDALDKIVGTENNSEAPDEWKSSMHFYTELTRTVEECITTFRKKYAEANKLAATALHVSTSFEMNTVSQKLISQPDAQSTISDTHNSKKKHKHKRLPY